VTLYEKLLHHSVRQLTRLAAVLALVGLLLMAGSILWPRPLPVILAMSVGHMLGAAAVLSYLLAIVIDASRRRAGSEAPIDSLAPPRDVPPSSRV
jgi:hypothetical protein